MAQFPFRGNLQTMAFPLLSKLSGMTVIDPKADQTFVPNLSTDGAVPVDRGAPQAYYAHNVMPSTYGWQSVGYVNTFFAPEGGGVTFTDPHLVFATRGGQEPKPTGFRSYIAIGYNGVSYSLYVVDTEFYNWREITEGVPLTIDADTVMTSAIVNGVTYLWLSEIGAFLYDDTIDTLLEREFVGLDPLDIFGIASSNGYMMAYSSNSVAWSSVVDVEDFEPSDVTGAGGGSLQEAEGRIIAMRPTVLGFLIFTEGNVVSATYSGNEDFPWNFKGITGSGGAANKNMVSFDPIAGYHYFYSTSGIQQVNHVRCNTIMPNVTDFISGTTFEDFDSETNTFTETEFTWGMAKAVQTISDRYLLISYGLMPGTDYTHALVIDTVQSRMGKLKIAHKHCFDRKDINEDVADMSRKSIAFLQADGLVKTVDFSFSTVAADAVLILGKFQLTRERLVEVHELVLNNPRAAANFSSHVIPSLNGKTQGTPVAGYTLESTTDYRHMLYDGALGINFSLLFKGTFNIISYVLWMTEHGRV